MKKIIALAALLCLVPWGAANAEPISIAIGLTALLSGTFLAGFGGTIIGIGLSIGISLAANLLKKTNDTPITSAGINAPDIRYNERQATPFKRIIVGTMQVGGSLFFESTKSGTGPTADGTTFHDKAITGLLPSSILTPYLMIGILLCARQISAVKQVWIGANQIAFSSLPFGSILTPIPISGQPDYSTKMLLSLRSGTTTQVADPLLAQDYRNLSFAFLDGTSGTPIGTLTGNGGLAAAFDNTTSKTAVAGATLPSTVFGNGTGLLGKDWGAGVTKKIGRFRVFAPNNANISNSASPNIVISLEGSTDNFATSTVVLYTGAAASQAASSIYDVLSGIDTSTAYRYHRIKTVEQSGDAGAHQASQIAQVQFYELTSLEFRQRGAATAVARFYYGADYTEFTQLWGQVQRPNLLLLVDGVAVYDPRDPTQSLSDSTTWKFSNNATLVQTYYLTQNFGGRISTSRIDWAKTKVSADWDDGLISTSTGSLIKRHTIDGVFNLNQSPIDVLKGMLTANGGQVLESGGTVWVQSSQPMTAFATINDDILTGGIDFHASVPKKNLVNRCKLRFVSEFQNYQIIDGPALSRVDLQASDGELLDASIELPFTLGGTQSGARAQRLQKRALALSRLGKRLTCQVDISFLACVNDEPVGQVLNFESTLFSQANGLYRITDTALGSSSTSLQLALVQYDATIETDWDGLVDEQPLITPTLNIS